MDKYMDLAYKEALKAFKKDEIPVGAVIVLNDKVIAKAHNNRQKKHNVLGHAEINAILKAEKKIHDWRLNDAVMYVTLKPCQMCEKVIKEVRIAKVYYLLDKVADDKENVENKDLFAKTNKCMQTYDCYKELFDNFFKRLRK